MLARLIPHAWTRCCMGSCDQPPRIAVLGSLDSWHCQKLAAAFSRHGIELSYADPLSLKAALGSQVEVSSNYGILSNLDLLLVREVPGGSLEQVIFRMDALHQLENSGVAVINSPYAIEKMVDKYYTLSLLQQAGISVPDTRVCEDFSTAMQFFEELGGDVVVKPLFGSRGIGMVRVTESDTAGRVFKALQMGNYVYYLQRFIPHGNRDTRVMVVGTDCIAAMDRVSDSWKTNIHNGSTPHAREMDLEMQAICLQAASMLGAAYCGIDLVQDEDSTLYVLEVNSMPAWQGLQQVTTVDIAQSIVNHCLSHISR